ncbi:MAG: nickel pincer cofactor biosynthesis protein LarC [Deltaproteobacteria bacterium]|nr:nickel pincer cofactor biosynthesis protein LarC [Deltaproteobacteria bacterium]
MHDHPDHDHGAGHHHDHDHDHGAGYHHHDAGHHHDHDHDHGAGHHHHGAAHHHHGEWHRHDALERDAGRGKLLFLDCFSGTAGDMTIAALLDLGIPLAVVEEAVRALPLEGYRLVVDHAHRSSLVATTFDVQVDGRQPERTYGAIDAMLASAPLDEATRGLARRIFRRLGEAEARVHRMPLEEVHFHEVGAVDAIVDIVGAAACIAYLGADVVASPVPLGRGFVRARHGILPLPAPAAVTCLAGVPTYGVELEAELVTPTGAAILATAATRFERWPAFAPERIGLGAGKATFADRPNLLRVVLGTPTAREPAPTHVVLEANVDDLTGELAGHAIAALMAAGALDAWALPVTMKKGRPGLVVSALARRLDAAAVERAMLRETSTLGVRRTEVSRVELERVSIDVTTRFGLIPVKVSRGDSPDLEHAKPELDACVKAATEHGVPLRLVVEEAVAAYRAR